MFPTPVIPSQGSKAERKLIRLFNALDASKQASLVSFAEFLFSQMADSKEPHSEQEKQEDVATEPLDIKRPENESVIEAIKRLSKTYPMVNRDNMLHPISDLMTAHILQGEKAEIVIDKLESVFSKEYQSLNQG